MPRTRRRPRAARPRVARAAADGDGPAASPADRSAHQTHVEAAGGARASRARIPACAIRARIGSGARRRRPSSAPAQPVEGRVQLQVGCVDPLEDAVQAFDLDVGVVQEAVVPSLLRSPAARVELRDLERDAPSPVSARSPASQAHTGCVQPRWLSRGGARPATRRRGRTRTRSARASGRACARGPPRCAAPRSARRSCAARPGTRPPRRRRGRGSSRRTAARTPGTRRSPRAGGGRESRARGG